MQPTSTQILKINQKQNKKFKGGFNMFKTMKKRIKNEKGLTLIELLAVVVILAIVAAIAVPAIGNIIDNSRYNAVKSDAINVLNSANLYFTENPQELSVAVSKLETDGFLESQGAISDAAYVVNGPSLYLYAVVTVNNATVTFTGVETTAKPTAKVTTLPANAATIDVINRDKKKGSDLGTSYTVGTTQ